MSYKEHDIPPLDETWYNDSFRMGIPNIRGMELDPITSRKITLCEEREFQYLHAENKPLHMKDSVIHLIHDDFRIRNPNHPLYDKIDSYFACFPEGLTIESGIIAKPEALMMMTILGMSDHTIRVFAKSMHIELPPIDYKQSITKTRTQKKQPSAQIIQTAYEEKQLFEFIQMLTSISGLDKTSVELEIDHFTAQFEMGKFIFSNADPKRAEQSPINHTRVLLNQRTYLNSNLRFTLINHRPSHIPKIKHVINSLISGNPHSLADADPNSLFNIFRYHDHRKAVLFTIDNNHRILFLPTFNFDSPHDIDLCLIVTHQETISIIESLLAEPSPRNHTIQSSNGWTIYQDGCQDLDPRNPVATSPILSRIHELITNPEHKNITWCSQFLPDYEDLLIMEQRLKSQELDTVTILAPDPLYWSIFYRLTGARKSLSLAKRLSQEYSDMFRVVFSQDRYLHAKCILIDDYLMIGSHNFNRQLVKSRTAEMAVEIDLRYETTDYTQQLQQIISQIRSF